MAYEGTTRKDLLPSELTSVKRLRESAGRLPDGGGFSTATVQTPKKKESAEGGPGSGPRTHGGSQKKSSGRSRQKTEAALKQAGFKNGEKGKHFFVVMRDGSWDHYHTKKGFEKVSGHPKGGYPTEEDTLVGSGRNHEDLSRLLNRIK